MTAVLHKLVLHIFPKAVLHKREETVLCNITEPMLTVPHA